MTDAEFDVALIRAGFLLAAERGWSAVTVVAAARQAGLKLDRARARFPARAALLIRFGRMADMAALSATEVESLAGSPPRDRLFDLVMRRIDVLQRHRDGVLALFRALPRHPATALMLGAATLGSMAWLLEAAGIPITGLKGQLRIHGMAAVWTYTVRAWETDASEDLSATLAALDRALDRAEQAEATLYRSRDSGAVEPVSEPFVLPVDAEDDRPAEPPAL